MLCSAPWIPVAAQVFDSRTSTSAQVVENGSNPDDATSDDLSSDDPEPVFTLGPMPLLPPPSMLESDDSGPVSAPDDVPKNDSTVNRDTPQRGSVPRLRLERALNPDLNTESRNATSVEKDDTEQLKPVAHSGTTLTLESGLVISAPGKPASSEPELVEEAGPSGLQTPNRNNVPVQASPSVAQPTQDTATDTFVEEVDYDASPAMEQVDVTAKRPPPPAPFQTTESGFSVSTAPPPGFEDLAGPQTTLVDVVYGKRVIASVMATFDMGKLEFDDPSEILAAIPDAADDAALLNALTGPLDANSSALCYSEFDTECGRLSPEIAAIIFDETRFRAELFIHPDYLETIYLADSMYLPRSDSGTASVHAFSMSANGDSADQILNLSATSIVSYRESRIESQYDIDSDEGLSIETLSLKHDTRGWEYEAGAFRSRFQSTAFLTEQNLVGARIASSLNMRTDLTLAEATPLFAFLEQRSRVDILRGDQLLDSQFYSAGNQQLDTSRLPDGAYTLTIRVVDDSGTPRETEYFFARNSVLPPKDQPLYFAELGQLAISRQGVLPEFTDSLWLRAGTAHRLQDSFGVEATVSSIGDTALIEGGLVWFQPGFQLQASALAGDTTGISLRSLWQRDRFAFSADIRRINNDEAVVVDTVELLPGAFTQANVTASFPLYDGRMLARGRWDMRGSRDYKSIGFNYSREVRRFVRSVLNVNVDTSFGSEDNIVRVGVDWRWRNLGRDAAVRPGFAYNSQSGSADALLNARFNATLRESDQGVVRASAFVDRDSERSVLGARLNGEGTRGIGELELQYGFEGDRPGAAYIANARFGVVSSGDQFAFGGRRSNTSSIIVEIDGSAPDAVFEVLVDRQSHGYAQSGSRTIIALQPYETYDVRLVSRGSEFVEFDQAPRSITLYPGNVRTLRFTAKRQIVVVGKVVDAEGYTIAHHTFVDLDGFASTDENGWFQIEITEPGPLTLKRGEASICTIELPIADTTESLVVLDELICRDN